MLERADCETSPDISGSVKTSESKLGMSLWDHSYHEIKKNIALKWQVETNFLKERKKKKKTSRANMEATKVARLQVSHSWNFRIWEIHGRTLLA